MSNNSVNSNNSNNGGNSANSGKCSFSPDMYKDLPTNTWKLDERQRDTLRYFTDMCMERGIEDEIEKCRCLSIKLHNGSKMKICYQYVPDRSGNKTWKIVLSEKSHLLKDLPERAKDEIEAFGDGLMTHMEIFEDADGFVPLYIRNWNIRTPFFERKFDVADVSSIKADGYFDDDEFIAIRDEINETVGRIE